MIELTENAITHLKTLTEKNKKNYVRLSVKGGGCAGFEYDWTFEDEEGYTRDDVLLEDLLLIDRMFEFYMLGMTLDYKEEILRFNGSNSFGMVSYRDSRICRN